MAKTKFQLNFENHLEIDVSGNTALEDIDKANWAALSEGIQTITPASSETADTTPYWSGEGFSDHDVTGKAVTFAVAGHRLLGDPAQDYVAERFTDVGDSLRTLARWTNPEGKQLV
ncbi:phage tail tube protein, partial [Weissella bombi]